MALGVSSGVGQSRGKNKATKLKSYRIANPTKISAWFGNASVRASACGETVVNVVNEYFIYQTGETPQVGAEIRKPNGLPITFDKRYKVAMSVGPYAPSTQFYTLNVQEGTGGISEITAVTVC
ncbi:hypothetical protein [uncultured virus]|uniref:Uncharacterized protein n=1 Tax=uncultured virus TaxID=340016 RepID=A0A218MN54_9VIRU|nr:hypothetical protein [uncultured virus]